MLAGAEPLDNVLSLIAAEMENTDTAPAKPNRDWGQALTAIRRAAAEMNATKEWARDMEARASAVQDHASRELQKADGRIHAAEMTAKQARSAEQNADRRAREAEARAQEAEDCLERLHDEIKDSLINLPGKTAQHAGHPTW